MSNKVKDIDIKTTHTTFSMIWSIQKFLIQIILKYCRRKVFLFTSLDMWKSKIWDM